MRRRRTSWRSTALLAALCCALLPALAEPAMLTGVGELAIMPDEPPRLRRALLAVLGLLAAFALCLRGWDRLDQRRHWRGCALVLGGWLLGVAALSLLQLNADPQTWDWWL
jgi:hypothetical protein